MTINSSHQQSLILQKARETLAQAEALVKHLEDNNLPEPDFSATSCPHPRSREYDSIANKLTQAAEDLTLLANGPMRWLRLFFCSHHDLGAWQAALRFNYFSIVPLDRPMSLEEIASAAGMDADRTRRIMKLLASQRCFFEPHEGMFEHTALSAFIAQENDIRAAMAFQADEMFEASSLTADSIEKDSYTSIAANSAFNLRFGTAPYQWYAGNPKHAKRFAAAMKGLVKLNRDHTEIRDRFDWAKLGNKTVVDVGGGSGHVSIYLAQQFPTLEFIVQDVNPTMLSQGPINPAFSEVEERVSFMKYDFLEPQPVQEAGLFFLRQITHNYPDDVCVNIFKRLAEALERSPPGTPLLINDMVLPMANTMLKVEEHHLRQLDMAMLNGYAAKQRTQQEFLALLKQADDRLEIVHVHGHGIMGLLEVQLQQQQV